MNKSLFDSIADHLTLGNVSRLVMIGLFILMLYALYAYCGVSYMAFIKNWCAKLIQYLGKKIHLMETAYHRDLTIGKINEKQKKVKHYRFLNDLIIDLGLKEKGCTPYEFLWVLILGSLLVGLIMGLLVFNNTFMIIPVTPIAFIGITCALYTKANVAHDRRIESVLESENVICNNIKGGVVVAVRNSINLMPLEVRDTYRDFLDDVESKNTHIRTALLELNNNLGSIADDFIKKCIVLETEEEKGIAGMFQDIVEINNIKSEIRLDMKRRFEKVMHYIYIAVSAIFLFLGGGIAIYPILQNFYFRKPFGQIVLLMDMLVMVLIFVYVTKKRAESL